MISRFEILGCKGFQEDKMEENKKPRRPDPERLEALRNLPEDILKSLTQEEVKTFLHVEIWPDSLREKLKDYLTD